QSLKKLLYSILLMMLLLTACSSKDKEKTMPEAETTEQVDAEAAEGNPQESEPEVSETAYEPKEIKYYDVKHPERELTELEQDMLRYPGIYSGDHYDEQKVQEALDELPEDLTTEQYLDELIYLLSEDYHEEMDTLF